MSIIYNQYVFSEPELLPEDLKLFDLILPAEAGVYAILSPDPESKPRPFEVLYFGESENIKTRACGVHEKYPDWKQKAPGLLLYRAFLHLPGSTRLQRQAVESLLIDEYRPPCNEGPSISVQNLFRDWK